MTELARSESVELTTIAEAIKREHGAAQGAFRSALAHAIACGELLTEAKARVGHGGWLRWLNANFPDSARTARNYMRLAANRHRVAHLPTVREAVAVLVERTQPAHPSDDENKHDDDLAALTERTERAARAIIVAKNNGCDIGSHLFEAEVHLQTALLWRRRSAEAALELAREYASSHTRYAAACADLAAVYLDDESGPWDGREQEAQERWQIASAELHAELEASC